MANVSSNLILEVDPVLVKLVPSVVVGQQCQDGYTRFWTWCCESFSADCGGLTFERGWTRLTIFA
ncbi:hypothetical protein FVEN_g13162 [Fusarium venenatum]|nr:hypothetical protein FVEN_g13162 [Fusarium venenatum]